MANKTLDFTLSFQTKRLLIVIQVLILAMLLKHLSLSMLTIMALCILWHVFLLSNRRKLPMTWLVQTIALVCCILLLITGPQVGLLLSMIHLMGFSYVLKSLQMRRRKDFYLVVMQGYFLLASIFIFDQDMLVVFAVLMLFIANTSLLYLATNEVRLEKKSLVATAKLIALSFPLAIVLFVFFPKLNPFWHVPLSNSAKTGLSTEVSPGDIANLVKSDELVFRAEFANEIPVYAKRYWRALVIDEFDGVRWKISQSLKQLDRRIKQNQRVSYQPNVNNELSYKVIAQATYQSWLYSLGVSNSQTGSVRVVPTNRLIKDKPITQAFEYQVYTQFSPEQDEVRMAQRWQLHFTHLPPGTYPQLVKWAKSLRSESSTDREFVGRVLRHINQGDYRYTVQPPILTNNSLEQFFFDSRAGFCEHYASSMTFILRAAGIPARMVTGYLGGEWNDEEKYMAVYQYDAHAWLEYWLPSEGWITVDPTAAVHPSRVESSLNDALAEEQALFGGGMLSLNQYRNIEWLNYLRIQLDELDYQWTKWVINYSADSQVAFLKKLLGQGHRWKNSLLISVALIIILLSAWWWLRQAPEKNQEEYQRLYQQMLDKLAKKGIKKPISMTLNEFYTVCKNRNETLAFALAQANQLYSKLAYMPISDETKRETLSALKQAIAKVNSITIK